jgi:uncharacterized protein (TIGR02246 family)
MDQLSATRYADRIRELNDSWLAAARRKDLEGMMAMYAPDAQELMPGQPAIVGRDAIREQYRRLIAEFPRFHHTLALDEITIAESGDLAVARGSYRFLFDDRIPDRVDTGKLVSVWVYLTGDWRLQVIISNSDIPPEPRQ